MDALKTWMDAAEKSFGVVERGIKNVADAMVGLTTATVAVGSAASKIGADFEQGMARVKAITGATDEQFVRLENTAREMGIKTVYSAREAADAMGFFALAGFDAEKIIAAMPDTLNLAAAGQLAIADAADIAAKIMSGMGIPVTELGHAFDVLTKAFTTANTDLRQLGEAMKYVGPIAHAAGVSLEDTVAPLQVMSNAGIQASMAGTSLRGILSHLTKGGKETSSVFKDIGVEFKNTDGSLRPLADIIDDFNAALQRQGRTAEATGLVMKAFGDRAGPGFATLLAAGGDEIRRFSDLLQNSAGTASRIAAVQIDTFKGALDNLMSAMEDVAIQISKTLNPTIRANMAAMTDWLGRNEQFIAIGVDRAWRAIGDAIQFVESAFSRVLTASDAVIARLKPIYDLVAGVAASFMEWFNSLSQGTQDLLVAGAALAFMGNALATIGGAIPLVGGFAIALGSLLNPLAWIKGAIGFIWPLLSAFGTTIAQLGLYIAGLGAPVAAAVAGIAALAAILGVALAHSQELRDRVGELWDKLVGIAEAVWNFVSGPLAALFEQANDNRDSFLALADAIGSVLVAAMNLGISVMVSFSKLLVALTGEHVPAAEKELSFFAKWIEGLAIEFQFLADVLNLLAALLSGDFTEAWKILLQWLLVIVETVEGLVVALGELFGLDMSWFGIGAKQIRSAIQSIEEDQRRATATVQEETNKQASAHESMAERVKAAIASVGQSTGGAGPGAPTPAPGSSGMDITDQRDALFAQQRAREEAQRQAVAASEYHGKAGPSPEEQARQQLDEEDIKKQEKLEKLNQKVAEAKARIAYLQENGVLPPVEQELLEQQKILDALREQEKQLHDLAELKEKIAKEQGDAVNLKKDETDPVELIAQQKKRLKEHHERQRRMSDLEGMGGVDVSGMTPAQQAKFKAEAMKQMSKALKDMGKGETFSQEELDKTIAAYRGMFEKIPGFSEKAWAKVEKQMRDMVKATVDAPGGMKEAVQEGFEEAAQKAQEAFNKAQSAGAEAIGTLKNKGLGDAQKMSRQMGAAFKDDNAALRDMMADRVSEASGMENKRAAVEQGRAQMEQVQMMQQAIQAAMQQVGNAEEGPEKDKAIARAQMLWDAYAQILENMKNGVKDVFDGLSDEMKAAVESMEETRKERMSAEDRAQEEADRHYREEIDSNANYTAQFNAGLQAMTNSMMTAARTIGLAAGVEQQIMQSGTEEQRQDTLLNKAMAKLQQLQINQRFGGLTPEMATQMMNLSYMISELQKGHNWDWNKIFPNMPMMAEGGVVTRPTIAMIGESGPEAVVPLSRLPQNAERGHNITIHASFNQRVTPAEAGHFLDAIEKEIHRRGVDMTGRSPLRSTARRTIINSRIR